jgi:hypothetical protein
MWIIAVLLFVLSVSLELAARAFRLDPAIVTVSGLAVSLLFGFEARALQILSLKRAGYNVAGMISAESRESAELQYFSRRPARTAQELPQIASSLPAMSQHHDALGLFGSH